MLEAMQTASSTARVVWPTSIQTSFCAGHAVAESDVQQLEKNWGMVRCFYVCFAMLDIHIAGGLDVFICSA
jgi:hypothetical protein